MDEISSDELYEGLLAHGLFTEKLPPVFTAEEFYHYSLGLKQPFSKRDYGFIFYESMRNTNAPRALGVPNPIGYQNLCRILSDNWPRIQTHFHKHTDEDDFKISRIHIRKRKNTKSLFKMNYQNWEDDDSPVTNILLGKRYIVHADISTCFPSMYSHALCWALVGKPYAKENRDESLWFNKIDHRCMETKSGETHGFLIGPHTSNLLSEIILTVVDSKLSTQWEYIRNIDDYSCFVSSYDDAQRFLTDLSAYLRQFDLTLNHKKTTIEKLPAASTNEWVRKLSTYSFVSRFGKVDYKGAQAYLDYSLNLMASNEDNSAILNYAIKVLGKKDLTMNAKHYCLKTLLHISVIYPYLLPLLEEHVFTPFQAERDDVMKFASFIYRDGLAQKNYEAIVYAIYYSLKYEFDIGELHFEDAIESDSCMYKMFAYLYYWKRNDENAIKAFRKHAKDLSVNDFEQNWIFVYEAMPAEQLKDEWKPMKKAEISFIKDEYRGVK